MVARALSSLTSKANQTGWRGSTTLASANMLWEHVPSTYETRRPKANTIGEWMFKSWFIRHQLPAYHLAPTPNFGSCFCYQPQLSPLLFFGKKVARCGGCEPALWTEGQVVDGHISRRLVNTV